MTFFFFSCFFFLFPKKLNEMVDPKQILTFEAAHECHPWPHHLLGRTPISIIDTLLLVVY